MPTTALPRHGVRPADLVVRNIAEGVGIANGALPAEAWQVDHAQPNVGVATLPGRDILYVTTGAVGAITRDELEAVCAAQLAIAHDPTVERLDRRMGAWLVIRASTWILGVPVIVIGSIAPVVGLPLLAFVLPAELVAWFVVGQAAVVGPGRRRRRVRADHPPPGAARLGAPQAVDLERLQGAGPVARGGHRLRREPVGGAAEDAVDA